MLETIRKVFQLFSRRERWQMGGLLAVAIGAALMEVLGVASIMPFIGILSQPELVQENEWLRLVYESFNFDSTRSFLIIVGVAVLCLMVLTNIFLAFSTILSERFVWSNHHKLSRSLLEGYLARPYQMFLNRNSAELSENILVETHHLTKTVLTPLTELVANLVSLFFILILLVVVDPSLALVVASVLGGAYATIYMALRKRLNRIGELRLAANTAQFKAVNEALGGIKDIKVLNREAEFIERFALPSHQFADLMATGEILKIIPRYIMEMLAFGSIMIIVLYNMIVKGDVQEVIPIVGLYAFAGYRLMPALKTIFKAMSLIRFQGATVDVIHREWVENQKVLGQRGQAAGSLARLPFRRGLQLDNVTFAYEGAKEAAVSQVTLMVPRNETVAFVGLTGAGKTTLVDVILGLFAPQGGYLAVDDIRIGNDNRKAWQQMVGYVPQQIFLCDDTIARNIAFGVPEAEINREAVEKAAHVANLHEFITRELPAGYDTFVGERGVRLSGGQRQRIGIARALYHDPDVLVLDEATSALDGITEDAVLQAINNIAHTKTLIIIAHRLSTVRDCDTIYLLDKGRLVASGRYEELLRSNGQFRAMAHMAFDGTGENGHVLEAELEAAV
jgi:ATP-binding cassette, subfamily B, bacterial PglK